MFFSSGHLLISETLTTYEDWFFSYTCFLVSCSLYKRNYLLLHFTHLIFLFNIICIFFRSLYRTSLRELLFNVIIFLTSFITFLSEITFWLNKRSFLFQFDETLWLHFSNLILIYLIKHLPSISLFTDFNHWFTWSSFQANNREIRSQKPRLARPIKVLSSGKKRLQSRLNVFWQLFKAFKSNELIKFMLIKTCTFLSYFSFSLALSLSLACLLAFFVKKYNTCMLIVFNLKQNHYFLFLCDAIMIQVFLIFFAFDVTFSHVNNLEIRKKILAWILNTLFTLFLTWHSG